MQEVGRGDDDGVQVGALQQAAVVLVDLRGAAADFGGLGGVLGDYVADGHDLAGKAAVAHGGQVFPAPVADADGAEADGLAGRADAGRQRRGGEDAEGVPAGRVGISHDDLLLGVID